MHKCHNCESANEWGSEITGLLNRQRMEILVKHKLKFMIREYENFNLSVVCVFMKDLFEIVEN